MGNKADRRTGIVADIAFGSSAVTVTAPTVAQITALTRIEDDLVDDSDFDTPRTGSEISIGSLSDRESSMVASKIRNAPVVGVGWRHDDGTDAAFVLFDDTVNPPTVQYLVVARFGFTGGTPTAGDLVDVYTVTVMHRNEIGIPADGSQRFEFALSVQNVETNVAVAA